MFGLRPAHEPVDENITRTVKKNGCNLSGHQAPGTLLDNTGFLERRVCAVLADCLECTCSQLNLDETIQLWHPDALFPQVGLHVTLDHLGNMTTNTTLLLGQTTAVNPASAADVGSGDFTNFGHDIPKVGNPRGA